MSNLYQMDIKSLFYYKNTLTAIAIVAVFGFAAKIIVADYNQKMQFLDKEKKKKQAYKWLVEEYNSLKSRYDSLAEKYFQKDSMALKNYVEKAAANQGMQINSLRPSREEKDFYWIEKIALEIDAPYYNFVQFVKDLESKKIEVEKIYMTQKGDKINAQLFIKTISL
ncbi:MAG: type 4a pilus biogenesis protein PilO [Candidatus Omnitrophica bacterium]|nr:type 4a pilus biogenesis protein PilO [Candidatus Omnitrophota bacterium]MCF7876936.1 type 4a pilus biogenesis protein PilO [Candidatus Omnitrophota bacterium]MCF7893063.1 type 4a pilus biogenesis protein PilO [Candidatus Omnitrophota bacterium]